MPERFRTAFLALVLLLILPSEASAIDYGGLGGRPSRPDPADARTKSWFIMTAAPGETVRDEMVVVNTSGARKVADVYPADSAVASGGGFALKQKADAMKEVGSWVKAARTEVTLEPHGSATVPFTLTVPEDAAPGEYTGGLIIQERAPPIAAGGGVNLSLRMGVRIYLTVPGEIVKKVAFETPTVGRSGKDWQAVVPVRNGGNASVDLQDGEVRVVRASDGEVVATAPLIGFQVLRGAALTPSLTWKPSWHGGTYRIEGWAAHPDADGGTVRVEMPPHEVRVPWSSALRESRLPGLALRVGAAVSVIAILYAAYPIVIRKRPKPRPPRFPIWYR